MHHFQLVPAFSAVINLLLVGLVIIANPRRRLNRIFSVLGLALVCWNVGAYVLADTGDPLQGAFWVRQSAAGAIVIPAAMFHLAVEFTGSLGRRKQVVGAYSASLVFIVSTYLTFGLTSGHSVGGIDSPISGPVFWGYCLWVLVLAWPTLGMLRCYRAKAPPGSARTESFLIWGTGILDAGLLHDAIQLLGNNHYPGTDIGIRPVGPACASLYGLLLAYGVFGEQFVDFRASIGRHTATVLRFLFLLGISYLALLLVEAFFPGTFSQSGLSLSLILLLVSASLTMYFFPKLLGDFTEQFEHRLSGDRFEYQDKVRAFVDGAAELSDFPPFLEHLTELVFTQFHLSKVGISIFDGDLQARGQSTRPIGKSEAWADILREESPLRLLFNVARPPLDLQNNVHAGPDERPAREMMDEKSLAMAFPIGPQGKAPYGLLVVGARRDRRQLEKRDKEALASLCRRLGSRIERFAALRNAALRQANSAKDRFLASINHEIRNPLNGIHGIVEMLRTCTSESRAAFLLSTIQSCADQLRSTMDEVLDFAKIEAKTLPMNIVEIDLVSLITTTVASHDSTGELLVIEALAGVPPADSGQLWVKCDAKKIRQILANYLSNALQYGVPPGARIKLDAHRMEPGSVSITISVTNTGPTLRTDDITDLFTPLVRGRRARETNITGSGLGLALCRKLAQSMDGSVGVQSAEGQTRFWFTASLDSVAAAKIPVPNSAPPRMPRRALVIDDEPYNRLILDYYFEQMGIAVLNADSGHNALAVAQNESFDLIVLDWRLPDMDGSELLSRLRSSRKATLPPVIVVSADSNVSETAEAGIIAFISKPVDCAKLRAALASCSFPEMG